ncbi:hypothetical protein D3C76_1623020 [compost metagenome]
MFLVTAADIDFPAQGDKVRSRDGADLHLGKVHFRPWCRLDGVRLRSGKILQGHVQKAALLPQSGDPLKVRRRPDLRR